MIAMNPEDFVAHRGWRKRYPENTLEAIEQAILAGARHIETDIVMSGDQQLLLCHDHKLQRLCGVDGEVDQLSWLQLQELSPFEPARLGDAFRGIRFSRLAEALALISLHPQVHFFIEVKSSALQSFGHSLVAEKLLSDISGCSGQCTIISFDIDILQMIKSRGFSRVGLVLSDWQQWQHKELQQLAPSVVFCDNNELPGDVDFTALPYPVAVYEIDTIERAQWLKKRGAKLIETFEIGEMLAKQLTTE